jgi:iron(III) transport system ATP-binding protein
MSEVKAELAVAGLSKIYAAGTAGGGGGIRPVSFTLEPGTFFTLLGPSGCGKTTTLRCIAGLERPDRGMIRLGDTVFFDEQRGINVPLNRRDIGMVFQSYAIWPHMSVFENVAFPLKVAKGRSYAGAEVKKLVGEALDRVALTGFENRSPTQLSGGQQQRVALARAIVRHPKLLLLDEPLSNLDAKLRDEMRHELKSLQKRIGVTAVYVTHDQSEALEMSDVIAVVNQGRLAQIGSPQEIFFEPSDAFVAGFMGSTNLLSGTTLGSTAKGGIGGVKLAVGGTIACRFRGEVTADVPTVVSVRPESIELKERTAPARDGWNTLDGTVVGCGFLGQSSRYSIRVQDLTLLAHVPSSVKFANGNEVSITFPQEAAIGLPAQASG